MKKSLESVTRRDFIRQAGRNAEMARNFRPLTAQESAQLAAIGLEQARKWGEHFGPAKEKVL